MLSLARWFLFQPARDQPAARERVLMILEQSASECFSRSRPRSKLGPREAYYGPSN